MKTHKRIILLASTKKRTTHYLMKKAMLEYIELKESRSNFICVAEISAREFDETGLHITLDEFDAWVDAIQLNVNTPMPVCHK